MTIAGLPFWVYLAIIAGIYALYGAGLQLEMGYGGQLNLGHVGAMAVSAYTMAMLVIKASVPLWLACLLAVGAATVYGLLLGLISLRLRSHFFAIASFAVAQIIEYAAANLTSLTGGPSGTPAMAGPGEIAAYNTEWLAWQKSFRDWLGGLIGTDVTLNESTMITVWVAVLVVGVLLHLLVRSPWGRLLRALREDPEGTESLGKNVRFAKVQVLMIGSAVGGVAGLGYAFQFGVFSPMDFDVATVLIAFVVVIVGGLQRVWAIPMGAIIYAVLYGVTRFLEFPPLSYLSSADLAYLRLIIIGLVIIFFVAFRPQGLFGKKEEATIDL